MSSFAPCPACQRHVRVADPTCPFCGAVAAEPRIARVPTLTTERVGRAAIVLLGLSLAACGEPQSHGATNGGPVAEPAAGSGGTTTTTTTSTAPADTEATPDAGTTGDAGSATSGPPNDNGSIVAMYGLAMQLDDAGTADAQPTAPAHHGHHGAAHNNGASHEPSAAPMYGAPAAPSDHR